MNIFLGILSSQKELTKCKKVTGINALKAKAILQKKIASSGDFDMPTKNMFNPHKATTRLDSAQSRNVKFFA